MLYPRLPTIDSFQLSARCRRNSFAAGAFLANFQIAYALGFAMDTRRPGNPCGSSDTCVFWNTRGFVSSVLRYAEIASWIQHATPEARKRLSEASSQEKTSGVIPSSTRAFMNRKPSRVSFESMRTFWPEGSASWAPYPNKIERRNRLES